MFPSRTTAEQKELEAEAKPAAEKSEEPMRPQSVDLVELEVGYELIPLVDGERGAVVERIRALRRQFVTDRGFLVPQIHIRDNLRLGQQAIRDFG